MSEVDGSVDGRSRTSHSATDASPLRLSIREAQAEENSRLLGLRLALMTLRLLEQWRGHLGVDHDGALIVLATLAITMEKYTRLSFDPEFLDVRNTMPLESLTKCNVSSIAAATGLNRETTRRKVHSLLEAGILDTDAKGSIRVSPDYTRGLRTSELLRAQLQTILQGVNDLLKQGVVCGRDQ